jgi:hypothetical protein
VWGLARLGAAVAGADDDMNMQGGLSFWIIGDVANQRSDLERFSFFVSNRSNCLFRSSGINIADYYSRALSRKATAVARPMPEAPPVTTTTLFAIRSAIPILRCNADPHEDCGTRAPSGTPASRMP